MRRVKTGQKPEARKVTIMNPPPRGGGGISPIPDPQTEHHNRTFLKSFDRIEEKA